MTSPGPKSEAVLKELIDSFDTNLPHFPDGRIDYSGAKSAPIITVFILCGNEFLLLKRSRQVRTYKGKWNTVAGYLDDRKTLREKALEELREEIGITEEVIATIEQGNYFKVADKEIGHEWHIFPVLAIVKEKPRVVLDFEHTDFAWITPEDATKYDTVPGFWTTLQNVLSTSLLKKK